jgi:hypothetical protein
MNRGSRILNWLTWTVVFIVGTLIFTWVEWHSDTAGALGWFISISIWSMVCGIGFSVVEWIIRKYE